MRQLLKYQTLVDALNISSDCPYEGCEAANVIGFRWVIEPLEDESNFLPKMAYDTLKNIPFRINNPNDRLLCSCCALSMFDSLEAAHKRFMGIPKRNRDLLGYTHVSQGTITVEDGLISNTSPDGHFDFFEYSTIELRNTFAVIFKMA